MSFRLAARIAALFDGTVDAVHFAEHHAHEADITVQSMPFLSRLSDDRVKARAEESQRQFKELIAPIKGATFTGNEAMTRDELVRMGRFASLVVIGRPGADDENISPGTVKAAIYDCARPGGDRAARPQARTGHLRRRRLERQRPGRARRRRGAALPQAGRQGHRAGGRCRARRGRSPSADAQPRPPRHRRHRSMRPNSAPSPAVAAAARCSAMPRTRGPIFW